MNNAPLPATQSFPASWFTFCLAVTVLIFVWIGIHSSHTYHILQSIAEDELRVTELQGEIIHLDEVLTMSARMGAVTGDLAWERRYRSYEPALDRSIKHIMSYAPDERLRSIARRIDEANLALVAMENQAFRWIHQGELAKAKTVLFSAEYTKQKHIYSASMAEYANRLQHTFRLKIQKEKSNAHHIIVMICICTFGLICSWIWVVKSIQKWRHTLEEARKSTEYAKEQQETALKELAQTNSELERFAYVASHDLQEPLRTVSSFVQLLIGHREEEFSAEARSYIGHIQDGITRMRRLTRDLLAYSQLNKPISLKPVECQEVLNHALKSLRAAIEESGIVITADKLPLVQGEKTQLIQLFQNVLSNAIKYRSPERPPLVHISAIPSGAYWQLGFSDNGIGIDPAHQVMIFSLFTRLHHAREYSGTGIGLAIAKKVVETHGGQIWVESKPNAGSCFYLTLAAV